MLTRRAVLTGTAAASIAAIASAHDRAVAASGGGSGFDVGFGGLEGGAIAGFNKGADNFEKQRQKDALAKSSGYKNSVGECRKSSC